jgi:hypothetical protein
MMSHKISCVALPNIFAHYEQSSPFGAYTLIGNKDGGFRILVRCNECGQHWQLDGQERYGVTLAIRILDADAWDAHNDHSARMTYSVNSRGGLSDEKCKEPDCPSRCVRGLERCAHHLVIDWG